MTLEAINSSVDATAPDSGVDQDIEDILDFTPAKEVVVEEPVVEPQVVETPGEPAVVEPVVVTPTVVEPVAPVAVKTELELLKEQNANLIKLVGETYNKSTPTVTTPTTTTEVDEVKSVSDILADMDFDDIMDSKEKFTQFIGSIVKSTQVATIKELSGSIPQMVSPVISNQLSMAEMHNQFYSNNPELTPLKGYVTALATELHNSNPDWSVGKVLDEVAVLAKSNLGLSNLITPVTPAAKIKPTLPGGTRSSKIQSPKGSTGMAEEIESLLDM